MLISLPEKVLRVGYCDHSQSGVRLSIPGLFKSSEKTIFNETLQECFSDGSYSDLFKEFHSI